MTIVVKGNGSATEITDVINEELARTLGPDMTMSSVSCSGEGCRHEINRVCLGRL